jgi:hypothetical protein
MTTIADGSRHREKRLAPMLRATAYRRHIENPIRAGNTGLPRLEA